VTKPHLADSVCPIDRSIELIGDRWTLAVLRDALHGMTRFNDFRDHLGVAKNILSDRLHRLVATGILERRPLADGRSEYVLTDKGRELSVVIAAIRQWGQRNLFDEGEEMTRVVDKRTGKDPARLVLMSDEGDELGIEDLRLISPNPFVSRITTKA